MADLEIVGGCRNVEAQYVEMMVPLYSYGCQKKVKKALDHLKGIYSVNVDFSEQKVTVWGICNKYDVLATIRNNRKGVRFWNHEDNVEFLEEEQAKPSSLFSKRSRSIPPLSLIKGHSLSWKAWKKVFLRRSYSF